MSQHGLLEAPSKPKDSTMESITRGFTDVAQSWDDARAEAFGSKSAFRADLQQRKEPQNDAKIAEALTLGFKDTHKLYGDQAEANTFGKVVDQPWNLKKHLQSEAA